jgi:hypothetical protein
LGLTIIFCSRVRAHCGGKEKEASDEDARPTLEFGEPVIGCIGEANSDSRTGAGDSVPTCATGGEDPGAAVAGVENPTTPSVAGRTGARKPPEAATLAPGAVAAGNRCAGVVVSVGETVGT